MYQEKAPRLFAQYALPQMAGLLLNSIYLIVDGIFIGNRLGREAMAAAAVAVPVIELLIAVSLAVATGAGVIISGKLGGGRRPSANQTFNLAVKVLAAVGLAIALLGNLFIGPLATLLGATPDIHHDAVTYLRYILTFSPFLLFSFLLSGLARNDNRPRLAMVALMVGSLSNILLDYVFMYPLNMGIAGAALATALGPILSVAILLPHFLGKRGDLFFAGVPGLPGEIRQILVLGFPAFIMEFSIGIVTFIYNLAIVRYGYGELGLAAYLIIGYLALIILTLFLGAAQGLQPVFSYYAGSGDVEHSRALLAFARRAVLLTGVVAYGLVLALGPAFVSVFASGDRQLLSLTARQMPHYFWGFPLAGFNILMISFWQSLKQVGSALTTSLLRSVLLLPVALLLLPAIAGVESIWACHSVAEVATAAIAQAIHLRTDRLKAQKR